MHADVSSQFRRLVTRKGESTFLNKHGYLSADRRPLQQFYGAMGLLYLLMGIFWGLMMACNHKDLLTLQYWVGFVLILCMLEMAFSWGDLFVWNDGGADGGLGARSRGLLVFAKLLSAVKNTLSRLLVLVTAMGLSVVKPRLGDVKKQITAVGVCSLAMFGIYGVVYVKRTKTPKKRFYPTGICSASGDLSGAGGCHSTRVPSVTGSGGAPPLELSQATSLLFNMLTTGCNYS